MKEKLIGLTKKKSFHIVIIILIITILLCILVGTILRYDIVGEKNMPFTIDKITIISTSEGTDKENNDAKWDFLIDQNNDIYIYIEKNENYPKTEIIDSVVLDNFSYEKNSEYGVVGVYKPENSNENIIFKTSEDNKTDQIEFIGDVNSDIKNLKMSNQGDMIGFRISNSNIKEYISNDEEVINHTELLKKINITSEELKLKVNFDITINLKSEKSFNTNVSIELPVGDVINEGTTSFEITDTSNYIFKRIRN